MSVDDFDAAVAAAAGGAVVLQFTAPWCEACRRAKPLVAQLAAQFADIAFLEVPDGADELVDRFGVSKLPMYIVQRSAAAGRESSGSGSWESASTVSQLAEKLAAVVPAAAQKRKAPADNCPAESPKRPCAAAAGGDGDATAAPTQSTAPLVGNCPLTASAAKFHIEAPSLQALPWPKMDKSEESDKIEKSENSKNQGFRLHLHVSVARHRFLYRSAKLASAASAKT